jgi:hypothetical protein
MPSRSFQHWATVRAASLDEIEAAHRALGGTGPGRRVATQQINFAYAILLSAQFQGFCRDLHVECADFLAGFIPLPALRDLCRADLHGNRRLDRGNPNPGTIGADFARLGLTFWPTVEAHDSRSRQRKGSLEELNEWRNAIAHQDFSSPRLGGARLQLRQVRDWRNACDSLAVSFDQVMREHLRTVVGSAPW